MKIFHSTVTALAVFLSLAACSASTSMSPDQSGTPADVDGPLPGTSTAVTSPVDEARAQGVQTYRQMWTAYATAGTTADWQSPELARYATGGALSTLTRGLFGYRELGIVTRGQPVLNPTVSSVEPLGLPIKVIVSDCGDSTTWTKHYADNGALADGEPGGKRHINAVVEKQVDGSWKVSDFGVHEVGTC
ncbi:hypothetical protein [Saccharothrix carnea]|nr:hypothetical protein [Saccharothrix carnea]